MAILQKESKAKVHFIGHNVNEDVYQYFSLYAVAYGVTKSAMFHDLAMEWMNKTRTKKTDEALMARVIVGLRKTYRYMRNRPEKEVFRISAREELLKKGIEPSIVERIIKKI
jgi:hypothetical protein